MVVDSVTVQTHIARNDRGYPPALVSCLVDDAPATLHLWGNVALLQQPSLALFSSARTPASVVLQIHDLAQHWRQHGPVIISGFHASVENEALSVLLRGPMPVVQVLARSMRARLQPQMRIALDEGRLLLVSSFPNTIRRATADTAYQRNRLVAALADDVLIAYAGSGSKTEDLAREVLGWGKRVYTLVHEANGHLLEMGAVPM